VQVAHPLAIVSYDLIHASAAHRHIVVNSMD